MILPGICNSYKQEIVRGIHSENDDYWIALFTSAATLGPATTRYTGQIGESSGDGYTPGGKRLQGLKVGLADGVAYADFQDPEWPLASITARGALIYNRSKENRAVVVLLFDKETTSTNGPFVVEMPGNDPETAVIALE